METQAESHLLSIGDVCEETGLSPDVIRVWERRYGFPVPVRLPSGHRRYRPEDLHRLRLMAEAAAQGHKPSALAKTDLEELRGLLLGGPSRAQDLEPLLAAIRELETERIRGLLDEALAQRGLLPFLKDVVGPLLERVGLAWAEGNLAIHHEHLLTEILEDMLRRLRAQHPAKPGQAPILYATLPGERHRLGLLMAALVGSARGQRTELLGVDLPVASIAAAARQLRAKAVAVSLSLQSTGEVTRRLLLDLQERLPPGCILQVGGQGALRMRRMEGVERLLGLDL